MSDGALRVDGARLRSDLETLSAIGRAPDADAGITRTGFSAADAEARQWYADRVEEAGLTLALDGLGNMVVADPDADPDVPAVWSGSHLDTVPSGGAFDGAVGAVAALECLRRLRESGARPARPLRAVVFSDEEGNYGSLLGSTGMRLGYDDAALAAMTGRDGDRLVDALASWRWASGSPTDTRIEPGALHAFVELHIEQGPHLEASGTDIGVVTGIVGLGGGRVTFTGRTDHAGTTPMPARADALVAASEFIAGVPAIAEGSGPESVATCGFVHVRPGAANVVPGEVEVSLDYRDLDIEAIHRMGERLRTSAEAIAAAHGCALRWEPHDIVPPAPLDAAVQDAIAASAAALALSATRMPSYAGHDAQNMAHLAPTAMVFVPSIGGRSHSPAELTRWPDVENGANVLLTTILALASEPG